MVIGTGVSNAGVGPCRQVVLADPIVDEIFSRELALTTALTRDYGSPYAYIDLINSDDPVDQETVARDPRFAALAGVGQEKKDRIAIIEASAECRAAAGSPPKSTSPQSDRGAVARLAAKARAAGARSAGEARRSAAQELAAQRRAQTLTAADR